MDQLRRVGGSLEPIRRPTGNRLLLPYELDLCESLGITQEEYWEFIFAAQEHVKERGPEYAHIPDVRNEPITIIAINLVIGVALTAIGALLAPKPKAPSQKKNKRLDIPGSQGRTRYTRSNNFDSVQQLANLGEVIPLVFARHRKGDTSYGGVRIETDLVHSQLITSGNNQILYAVMLLGMGKLGDKPDYDGFAIGDLLLRDFSPEKNKIYYADNIDPTLSNRLKKTDAYSRSKLDVPEHTDAFSVYWPTSSSWQQYFSGTRTPSTKTQFGCYSPISNGHRFYLPMELVQRLDGSGSTSKNDAKRKRNKLSEPFARFAGLVSVNGRNATYKCLSRTMDSEPSEFKPWGIADAISIQNESRVSADEALQPNQEFMFGNGVVGRVISRTKDQPWYEGTKDGHEYIIKLDESVKRSDIDYAKDGKLSQNTSDAGGGFPWERSAIQQVAIASLTNSRPCDATEIGIKSEVWRQITGSINFNAFPTKKVIEKYEQDGNPITIGSMTKYMKRYSFFALFARALGDESWLDVTGPEVFAVLGTSPVNKYNTIHVMHPQRGAYEYKIMPVPGARFYRKLLSGDQQFVKLLTGAELYQQRKTTGYNLQGYFVQYTGKRIAIGSEQAANSEWIVRDADLDEDPTGPIATLENYQSPEGVQLPRLIDMEDRYIDEKYVEWGTDKSCVQQSFNDREAKFFWEGARITGGRFLRTNDWYEVKVGHKTFVYKKGAQKQEAKAGVFVEADDSPGYVVVPFGNPYSGQGYVTCIYKGLNGRFYYKWDTVTVREVVALTNNWYEYTLNGKRCRFRVAMQSGSFEDPITEESIVWTNDDFNTDLFVNGDPAGDPYTGAVLKDDGLWYFFKDGLPLGRSNVPGENRSYYVTSTQRWRAEKRINEDPDQREITLQNATVQLKTWRIEKQEYQDEKPAKWKIQKWRTQRKTKEDFVVYTNVDIRSAKNGGDRNTTAKATVKEYQGGPGAPGLAYSWEIERNGTGYVVGEKVWIGKFGPATTVAGVEGAKIDDDDSPSYWDLLFKNDEDGKNYFPLNAICDYYINGTDTTSHANRPEHNVVFCNELITQLDPPKFKSLALCGIKITNSKEWSSFSNLSAWIDKGLVVERLIEKNEGPTNLFPDIAYALLTDTRIGAGKAVGARSVNRKAMEEAARFCEANNFYWDGVISESLNLREFIFENAAFILCDFTIKGGQFALVPSVPYGSDYKIQPTKRIKVKALFTDGNMAENSMKVTFLPPEERQAFKAVVLYREETKNSFAEIRSLTTWFKGSGGETLPVEEFDLTQFCTSRIQAQTFSRIALMMRKEIDHGITFETTPQSAMNLEPGDYFKVATKVTHTDRFQSGTVDPFGNVVSSIPDLNSSIQVVYWKPGWEGTRTATLAFTNRKTTQNIFYGTIWCKVTNSALSRVYKCETLSYAENGLVSITGSYAPLTDSGSLRILDYEGQDLFNEEFA